MSPRNALASILFAAAIVLSSAGANIYAATISYTDRATFEAAASGLTEIDFNDQVTSPNTFTSYGTTTTISGVTFSDTALFAVTSSYFSEYDLGDSVVLSFQEGNPNGLTISLPAGTTAVGMDFGAFSATTFTFTLSNGFSIALLGSDAPDATPTFAGFIADAPFASLTISAGDIAPQIDQFVFGSSSASPVPEPATLLFVSTGLAAGVRRYRRRKV